MKKQIKPLLWGIAIAGVIAIAGYGQLMHAASQLPRLVEKCKAEHLIAPKGPWLEYQKAPLVCDPEELRFLSPNDAIGTQRGIVTIVPNAQQRLLVAAYIAFSVPLISFLPFVWQFFLQRIREVANAITGR